MSGLVSSYEPLVFSPLDGCVGIGTHFHQGFFFLFSFFFLCFFRNRLGNCTVFGLKEVSSSLPGSQWERIAVIKISPQNIYYTLYAQTKGGRYCTPWTNSFSKKKKPPPKKKPRVFFLFRKEYERQVVLPLFFFPFSQSFPPPC